MNESQLVRAIKAHIEKGDKAKDKAEQHYIAAGQHLKTLKAEHKGNWAEWEELLKSKIGIGKSRASELMQIADGRKTIEQTRDDTNKRKIEHRKIPPFRNGEDEPKIETVLEVSAEAEFEKTITPPIVLERLRAAQIKITGLEAEIEDLKRENADLRQQLEVFKSPVRCEFVEDDGGRAAAGYGEAEGDCVARAITIATGKPYTEVFEALKAAHARYVKRLRPGGDAALAEERRRTEPIHNGCDQKVYGRYLRSLGWQYTRIRERLCLRAGALPSGRLVVDLDRHLVALIDGVIHDTYDSGGAGRRPVKGYYRQTEQAELGSGEIATPLCGGGSS